MPRLRNHPVFWDGKRKEWTNEGQTYSYAEAKEIHDTLAERDGILSLIVAV